LILWVGNPRTSPLITAFLLLSATCNTCPSIWLSYHLSIWPSWSLPKTQPNSVCLDHWRQNVGDVTQLISDSTLPWGAGWQRTSLKIRQRSPNPHHCQGRGLWGVCSRNVWGSDQDMVTLGRKRDQTSAEGSFSSDLS
jgi:hypothetical protein